MRNRVVLWSVIACLLLGSVGMAMAQGGRWDDADIVHTIEEINAAFDVSSRGRVTATNTVVSIMADGRVQISFDASVSQPNGETTTINGIIAILIGMLRPNGFLVYRLEDILISSAVDPTVERGLTPRTLSFIAADWNRYLRMAFADVARPLEMQVTEGGIAARSR